MDLWFKPSLSVCLHVIVTPLLYSVCVCCYRCPVLFKIDLQYVIDIMSEVGAHSHAISLIQLLDPQHRTSSTDVSTIILLYLQQWLYIVML